MDSSKKYEYVLEPSEIREFCLKSITEALKYRKKIWVILVFVMAFEVWASPRAAVVMVLMVAAVYLAAGIYHYRVLYQKLSGQPWVIWVEDGRLKAKLANYSEAPCRAISLIRMTDSLLMLGYMQTAERPAWFVMPLRVFGSQGEREEFLDRIRNPQAAAGTEDAAAVDEGQLVFAYMLGEDKWVRFQKGALALINGGTLGRKQRAAGILIFSCEVTVIMLAASYLAAGHMSWILAVVSLVMAALLILWRFCRDPQRSLQRQMKSPVMREKVCGRWRVSLSEEEVSVTGPTGIRSSLFWETFGWLAETEEVFYLFYKDKRHFVMIAKESFQSREQVEAFWQMCGRKGIERVPARKMRYLPGWFFGVVSAFLLLLYAALFVTAIIWEGRQSAEEEQGAYLQEDFASLHAGHVSLDQQVKVLESLGLHVPQETVDSLRESAQTYDLYELMEDSPYTWLLMALGAPSYDEESGAAEYSGDVFWFDMEGYDLSTDYIGVLEGMAALAEGSCIDDVSDISEDTEAVDWENGTGTVTVSLKWKGQAYQWDMEVEYDWLDARVLAVYNTLLEQENAQEYFYVTGDGGQGAVVFFCTEEWAGKFTRKTGLSLERISA